MSPVGQPGVEKTKIQNAIHMTRQKFSEIGRTMIIICGGMVGILAVMWWVNMDEKAQQAIVTGIIGAASHSLIGLMSVDGGKKDEPPRHGLSG